MKSITKIILLLVVLYFMTMLLQGCVTYKKCVDKFGETDSVRITITKVLHDTVRVVTAADSLEDHFNVDSLLNVVDTLRHTSASGKLQIQFWRDKYSRQLHYRANHFSDTIVVVRVDTVTVVGDCPPGVTFSEKEDVPWFRALWLKYQLFAAWALLLLLFVLVFLKKIKSLFQ
jgi:hypothetical protein